MLAEKSKDRALGWDGAARTTGRTAASSLSVFIGECILDILAIKSSSTKFPSPDAVAEGVLDRKETTRASADLFLRAATFIESPDPQRSEEQELEEEKGDADRAAAKPAATGVPRPGLHRAMLPRAVPVLDCPPFD